jgi:predicted RNA methylase
VTGVFDNADFYPTPTSLAHRMLRELTAPYDRGSSFTLLEPSAGKGDLLDAALSHFGAYDKRGVQGRMYAIEAVPDLRAALSGKGYSVIGTDFLAFDEPYHFDVVLMNPPFSVGAAHLLKAWQVVAAGGQIVCLLNAETVRNPCDEKRRAVLELIDKYGTVDFISDAFAQAERHTRVEVALVHLAKPAADAAFTFENLEAEKTVIVDDTDAGAAIERHDAIRAYVRSYDAARDALAAIDAHARTLDLHVSTVLRVKDVYLPSAHEKNLAYIPLNVRLTALKEAYWRMIFAKLDVAKRATSKFREDFYKFVSDNSQLAFTEANIMQVLSQIIDQQQDMVLASLMQVYEKITCHHYADEYRKSGWKTNKSWKVPRKFIVPNCRAYETIQFFDDLDRLCCYLSGKQFETIVPVSALIDRYGWQRRETPDPEPTFFEVKTFQKGTAHVTWRDPDLLAEFNRRAADGHSIGSGKY